MNGPETYQSRPCPKCGRPISPGSSFCSGCGARLFLSEQGPDQSDPYIGSVFDNIFRIDSLLGNGSMGIVYKATHLTLNTQVAVKVLRQEYLSDSLVLARFQREAEASSRLMHPNVIRIFHYGSTFLNAPYLVMELINGTELSELVRNSYPLPPERICTICAQIASALSEAHSVGIIHRDLKPANIIVCQKGGSDFVKVLDFGIAKLVDDGGQNLTKEGAVCGTPAFMSPEQILGKEVTPSSDIFSLGSVMYFMLTGKLPFSGSDMVSIAASLLNDTPVAPSRARFDVAIPEGLEAICLRALNKDPSDRFASALDMSKALDAELLELQTRPLRQAKPKVVVGEVLGEDDKNKKTSMANPVLTDELLSAISASPGGGAPQGRYEPAEGGRSSGAAGGGFGGEISAVIERLKGGDRKLLLLLAISVLALGCLLCLVLILTLTSGSHDESKETVPAPKDDAVVKAYAESIGDWCIGMASNATAIGVSAAQSAKAAKAASADKESKKGNKKAQKDSDGKRQKSNDKKHNTKKKPGGKRVMI